MCPIGAAHSRCPKCMLLIITGPNDLFSAPLLPPHVLHPPRNFRTTLHILLDPKPYPTPYLTLPLHSPRRFPLALASRTFTQKPLQRDSTQGTLVSSCILGALFPFFPSSHPGFPSRIYFLHGFGATCPPLQAGRNILRTQELPENQRPPSPSQETPEMVL